MAFQGGTARLADTDKIIQNAIGDVFVEDPFVAKLLQIQLEALQFDAQLGWHVVKDQRPEIGLARFGADRREFGTSDLNLVGAVGKTILENF